MKKLATFTGIAALLVCSVVAVAVGFLIWSEREATLRRERLQLEALEQAFLAYRDIYGQLPDWGDGQPFHITEDMLAVLEGENLDGLNPLGRIFIEWLFPRLDFWGNPIWIVLAGGGEDSVQVGDRRLPQPAAAWSPGPDGVNPWGLGDDVTPGG